MSGALNDMSKSKNLCRMMCFDISLSVHSSNDTS